jgi:hypothetical protein
VSLNRTQVQTAHYESIKSLKQNSQLPQWNSPLASEWAAVEYIADTLQWCGEGEPVEPFRGPHDQIHLTDHLRSG